MTDASSREQERFYAQALAKLRKARRAPAKAARAVSLKADPAAKFTREPGAGTKRKATTFAIRNAFLESHNDGRCAKCDRDIWFLALPFEIDHITPLELGGHEGPHNLQALCIPCHKAKTKLDVARIAKAKRQAKLLKPREKSKRPIRSRGFG